VSLRKEEKSLEVCHRPKATPRLARSSALANLFGRCGDRVFFEKIRLNRQLMDSRATSRSFPWPAFYRRNPSAPPNAPRPRLDQYEWRVIRPDRRRTLPRCGLPGRLGTPVLGQFETDGSDSIRTLNRQLASNVELVVERITSGLPVRTTLGPRCRLPWQGRT